MEIGRYPFQSHTSGKHAFFKNRSKYDHMPTETDEELREILDLQNVAVVGASTSPGKAAHYVPKYLQDQGFNVIPVNPFADEVLGTQAYDSLEDVDEEIEIVDVFRPSEEVQDIVQEVLAREDVTVVWLQEGITHDEAGLEVEESGRQFVQDHCMKQEYERLC